MAYTFNLGFASLLGVQIVTPPTKTQYEEGETIDVTGMVVALAYSDGYLKVTSDYTYTPQTASLGDTEITVSVWTSRGFLTATTPITVGSETRLQVPEYIGDLYYFYKRYRNVNNAAYWNNYDSEKMVIGGTTTGLNAGFYTATFTPKSGYMWEDGTTVAKSVTWSIRRPSTAEMVEGVEDLVYSYSGDTHTLYLGCDPYVVTPTILITNQRINWATRSIATSDSYGEEITIAMNDGWLTGTFNIYLTIPATANTPALSNVIIRGRCI